MGVSAMAVDRPFHTRGFASLLMLVSFPLLVLSGIVLYIAPRGRFANWNEWFVLGLRKDQWSAIHINLSLLFLIMALLHMVMNWRVVVAYFKRRRHTGQTLRKEFACATALLVALLAGTLAGVMPFQTIIETRYRVRDSWEQREQVVPTSVPQSMRSGDMQ